MTSPKGGVLSGAPSGGEGPSEDRKVGVTGWVSFNLFPQILMKHTTGKTTEAMPGILREN
jgi:hypothetical protein